MSEFICIGCGRIASVLPEDHESAVADDAFGWPIMLCNYGVSLNTYTIEGLGS